MKTHKSALPYLVLLSMLLRETRKLLNESVKHKSFELGMSICYTTTYVLPKLSTKATGTMRAVDEQGSIDLSIRLTSLDNLLSLRS